MQAKDIAAIIESCCRAQLNQVHVDPSPKFVEPLSVNLGQASFDALCKAIAGNAAMILAEDDDLESDGVPMACIADLDRDTTEAM